MYAGASLLPPPCKLQVVSLNLSAVTVDRERATVQGVTSSGAESTNIQLKLPDGSMVNQTVTLENVNIGVRAIDPILSSLRVSVEEGEGSRLLYGSAKLELLSKLFFFQETAQLTASAILSDGRRVVINPSELNVSSSNISIVSVEGNKITAQGDGVATLNVTWSVCPPAVASVEVEVEFDSHIPLFTTDTQRAEVPEDSEIGYSITTVIALDRDFEKEPSRSDVEYRVMQPDPLNGLFGVDAITGEVFLNGLLDREITESYELIIEATDRQQRLAEQERESITSSGSGSGDILVPDGSNTTEVAPPSRLKVFSLQACLHHILNGDVHGGKRQRGGWHVHTRVPDHCTFFSLYS